MELAVEMEGLSRLFKSGRMDLARFLKLAGPGGVSADGVMLFEGPWMPSEKSCRELHAMLEDNELLVASYALRTNFVSRNLKLRLAEEDKVRRALAVARAIDTDKLTIHGGPSCPGISHADGLAMLVESLQRLVRAATKAGVVLAITNAPEFPSTIDDLMSVISRLDSACVRPCLDTANFLVAGDSPNRAVNELASSAALVRVTDVTERDGALCPVPAGSGQINIKDILSTLNRLEYKGYLTVCAPEAAENAEEFISESAAKMRKLLGRIWR